MTIWFVHRNGGPGTPISSAHQGVPNGEGGFVSPMPDYCPEALDDASDAEIQAFLNPPATPEQILAQKTAAGLAITSTGTSSLNATYALDQTSQDQLWNIALGLASGLGFPGGESSFAYPDFNGVPRTFSAVTFTAFAKAVRDYVFALKSTAAILAAGGQADWPSASVTIP